MTEPFLIASLWGNLSEDNSAKLVSSGTTFQFQDDLDDVWGEISGGVNLFNFSQTTPVFAKVDYTFGEDVQCTAARPVCTSPGRPSLGHWPSTQPIAVTGVGAPICW